MSRIKHVFEAIKNANCSDRVEEGSIGAATGFMTFQLKSGVGTSSRGLPKSKTRTDNLINRDHFFSKSLNSPTNFVPSLMKLFA